MEDFGIPPYLSSEVILKLARNAASRRSMLLYFDEKFDELKEYFDGINVLGKSLQTAARYWNTPAHLQEVLFYDPQK